jgi:hypothetical protein
MARTSAFMALSGHEDYLCPHLERTVIKIPGFSPT